jgi:hypothetical protein
MYKVQDYDMALFTILLTQLYVRVAILLTHVQSQNPNTHIYVISLSWFGTGTSIKGVGLASFS